MIFEEIFSRVSEIKGWFDKEDCLAVWKRVKDVEGLIVEIGSYAGRSTVLLALSSPKSRIITVDSYPKNKMYYDHFSNSKEIRNAFRNVTKGLNVTLLNKTSRRAALDWTEPVDFLLVDGKHDYYHVKEDLLLFVPHIKKGSYIVFHDYLVGEYGVKKVIEELKDKYFESVVIEGNCAVCKI